MSHPHFFFPLFLVNDDNDDVDSERESCVRERESLLCEREKVLRERERVCLSFFLSVCQLSVESCMWELSVVVAVSVLSPEALSY